MTKISIFTDVMVFCSRVILGLSFVFVLNKGYAFAQTASVIDPLPSLKLPYEDQYIPYNDDWAVATLRWLRDQDVALADAQKLALDAEEDRVLIVLRDNIRSKAEEILREHRGALPLDIQDFLYVTRERSAILND